MKQKRILAGLLCLLLMLGCCFLLLRMREDRAEPVNGLSEAGKPLVRQLLSDLLTAAESPSGSDGQTIAADLSAIRAQSRSDWEIAKPIAEHWQRVYLDPDYRLYLDTGDASAACAEAGIPDSPLHAIVVLGYELRDGQMLPELVGRCEAAAALARARPAAILICSGGATGANNPEGHTEAGLMKAYLTDACGIAGERIFIDERAMTTADNAVNSYAIMQEQGVKSMTIVTSSYHQRWGQALYNAVGALYRQQSGYAPEILGNYCYDTETDNPVFRNSARIALQQIAGLLGVTLNTGRPPRP